MAKDIRVEAKRPPLSSISTSSFANITELIIETTDGYTDEFDTTFIECRSEKLSCFAAEILAITPSRIVIVSLYLKPVQLKNYSFH